MSIRHPAPGHRPRAVPGVAAKARATIATHDRYVPPWVPRRPSPGDGPVGQWAGLPEAWRRPEDRFIYRARLACESEFIETLVLVILWLCGLFSIGHALSA